MITTIHTRSSKTWKQQIFVAVISTMYRTIVSAQIRSCSIVEVIMVVAEATHESWHIGDGGRPPLPAQ